MISCPSRFELRQLVAGDVESGRMELVTAHLEECATCCAFLDRSRAASDSYFEQEDAHLQELRMRLSQEAVVPISRRNTSIKVAAGIAVALAASLAIIFVAPSTKQASAPGVSLPEGVSYRGTAALEVFVKRGELVQKVAPKAEMYEDDMLRFFITTDEPGYATIFSIDSGGELFTYYPSEDEAEDHEPMRFDRVGRNPMPGSVVLDDSLGEERFILLFSAVAYDRSAAVERVGTFFEKTGEIPEKMDRIKVDSLMIRKAR